jgi:molecular chaperone GrpE
MTEPKATPTGQTPQATGNGASGDGTDQAGAQVLADLEALRTKVQAAEQARDQYLELAQRTKADFENYQKRMQRDLATERRFAQAPLAVDLLSALDNLERATAAAHKAGETGPLVQGVALVQSQVLDILRRHGVVRMDAQGKPFDPNQHQAVMQQPSHEHPPMTVLQVLEHGYMIYDRVLRPARVAVSTAPPEPKDKKPGGLGK